LVAVFTIGPARLSAIGIVVRAVLKSKFLKKRNNIFAGAASRFDTDYRKGNDQRSGEREAVIHRIIIVCEEDIFHIGELIDRK